MAPPCTHTGASVASTSSAEYKPHGSTPLKSLDESPRCVFRGLLRPSVIRTRDPGTSCVSSSTVAPGGTSYLSIAFPSVTSNSRGDPDVDATARATTL